MQKALELIDRRIAAHRGAIETLESLRVEMAAELLAAKPASAPAPAAPPPAPCAVPPARPAPPSGVTVGALGPLPMPTTPAPRTPGRPGRPPNPSRVHRAAPPVRRDPPPPPGLSIQDRILEAVTERPMTSGELVARMPGVMPNSIYSDLAKMRRGGVLAMWEDPGDGQLKNRLMSTMVADMVAAEPPAEQAARG